MDAWLKLCDHPEGMKCPTCKRKLVRLSVKKSLVDACPNIACGFHKPVHKVRVQHMWVFVIVDAEGNECIPAYQEDKLLMPMIAGDPERLEELRFHIPQLQKETGMKVKILKFTHRVEVPLFGPLQLV